MTGVVTAAAGSGLAAFPRINSLYERGQYCVQIPGSNVCTCPRMAWEEVALRNGDPEEKETPRSNDRGVTL